jgi:hypothetical protein
MKSSTRSRANLMAAVLVGIGPSSSRPAADLASAPHGLAGQRGDVDRRVDREQHVPAEDFGADAPGTRPLLSRRHITIIVVDNADPHTCPRKAAHGEVDVRVDARRR